MSIAVAAVAEVGIGRSVRGTGREGRRDEIPHLITHTSVRLLCRRTRRIFSRRGQMAR